MWSAGDDGSRCLSCWIGDVGSGGFIYAREHARKVRSHEPIPAFSQSLSFSTKLHAIADPCRPYRNAPLPIVQRTTRPGLGLEAFAIQCPAPAVHAYRLNLRRQRDVFAPPSWLITGNTALVGIPAVLVAFGSFDAASRTGSPGFPVTHTQRGITVSGS